MSDEDILVSVVHARGTDISREISRIESVVDVQWQYL